MERHYRSHRGFGFRWLAPIGLALAVCFASAHAAADEQTEKEYAKKIQKAIQGAEKAMAFAAKLQTGVTTVVAFLDAVGVLGSEVTTEDLQQEMLQIAAYQDQQTKYFHIVDIDTLLVDTEMIMHEKAISTPDDTFGGIEEDFRAPLFLASLDGVSQAFDPHHLCIKHPLFQTLDWEHGAQGLGKGETYDWRIGLSLGMEAVGARLLALAALDPNFKQNIDTYASELDGIRQCLIQHRDLILPPKPFTFCEPNWAVHGCDSLYCWDHRPWPLWETGKAVIPFPKCIDFVDGKLECPSPPNVCDDPWVPSYASHVQFEDLRAATTASIEHDYLPILLPLQKMIDTLYLLTAKKPDLTATSERIPFGADPQLCLSPNGGSWQGIEVPSLQSCSSGPEVGWTYDRGSGRIRNTSSGRCLTALGVGDPVSYGNCTTAVDDESQIWQWDVHSGKLKNMVGTVLTVTGGPSVGSLVTTEYEHRWKVHMQTWTDGTSSTCSGAICPAPGPLAWNQGEVGGGSLARFPIDFNIFSYLYAAGLEHVGGPVAVSGTPYFTPANEERGSMGGVDATDFGINGASGFSPAIIMGGGFLYLNRGTIMNAIWLDPQVTKSPIVDLNFTFLGWDQNLYTRPSPINFEMAFLKLQGMSYSLPFQGTGTVEVKWNNTIEFTSLDPNANPQVFNIHSSILAPTNRITSIQMVNVPDTATVVINVYGEDVVIRNAGLAGFPSYHKVIWNFKDAKRLRLGSTQIVGSILAPYAGVRLTTGFVTGTVASWALNSKWGAEFHQGQFRNNAVVPGP